MLPLAQALDSQGSQVAVGGEGHQVQVWSLATSQEVFKAKGGKPNRVGNVDLPHVTAVTFLPDPSGQQLVAGTVKVSRDGWSRHPSVTQLAGPLGDGVALLTENGSCIAALCNT